MAMYEVFCMAMFLIGQFLVVYWYYPNLNLQLGENINSPRNVCFRFCHFKPEIKEKQCSQNLDLNPTCGCRFYETLFTCMRVNGNYRKNVM